MMKLPSLCIPPYITVGAQTPKSNTCSNHKIKIKIKIKVKNVILRATDFQLG